MAAVGAAPGGEPSRARGAPARGARRARWVALALLLPLLPLLPPLPLLAQGRRATPIRQGDAPAPSASPLPVTLRDASRHDRWLGLSPRDVRWAPDSRTLYFRWHERPASTDLPEADPWYRTDRDGTWVERVPAGEVEFIPGDAVAWNDGGTMGAWVNGSALYLHLEAGGTAAQAPRAEATARDTCSASISLPPRRTHSRPAGHPAAVPSGRPMTGSSPPFGGAAVVRPPAS